MSVVKSKRGRSKDEFGMVFFQLVDGIDTLIEHQFYSEGVLAEKNKVFLEIRCRTLEDMTDKLLYHIKVANSIYPTCYEEWAERRVEMGKAIGTCYAILTNLERILTRLRVPDFKYTTDIRNISKMINSLKAWRKSDNKLKEKLEKKQP